MFTSPAWESKKSFRSENILASFFDYSPEVRLVNRSRRTPVISANRAKDKKCTSYWLITNEANDCPVMISETPLSASVVEPASTHARCIDAAVVTVIILPWRDRLVPSWHPALT